MQRSNLAGASPCVTHFGRSRCRSTCEHNREEFERLTVSASTYCGTLVNLTLWEDRTIWVRVILRAAENIPEYELGFYPPSDGLTSDRLAEAFRDTVATSTPLCYSDSPEPIAPDLETFRRSSDEGNIESTPESPASHWRERRVSVRPQPRRPHCADVVPTRTAEAGHSEYRFLRSFKIAKNKPV